MRIKIIRFIASVFEMAHNAQIYDIRRTDAKNSGVGTQCFDAIHFVKISLLCVRAS